MADKIEIKVYDTKGAEAGSRELSSDIFGIRVRPGLVHEVIRWQRARWRAGTHAVQTRAEASGGGKKPWRQKGLGKARAGSNTSPVWVGGGVAHGPKPRDYDFSLNKKFKKKVLCGVLSSRVKDGKCLAFQGMGIEAPKTKAALNLFTKVGINGKKTLVIFSESDKVGAMSARNLERVKVLTATGVNTYDVVNSEYVVFTEQGLTDFESRMGKEA